MTQLIKRKLALKHDWPQRQETLLGGAHDLTYEYDVRGRVVQVTRDGAVVSSYDYDDNGNRLSATLGSATVDAAYDGQDRLVSYGTSLFSYDPLGRLTEKRDGENVTTYGYDAFGPLRSVTMPDGKLIEYVGSSLYGSYFQ